jgi:hypothetical protein
VIVYTRRLEPSRKNGGKWRFFDEAKAPIPVLEASDSRHKAMIWPVLCRPTFLTYHSKKNGGAPFSGEDVAGDDANSKRKF